MGKKGFTIIELMIVVVIVGVMAAITIPHIMRLEAKGKAETNIENGVKISTVKDKAVREVMVKILQDTASDTAKANADELQAQSFNTVIPVLKDKTLPQSINNTVIPVLNKTLQPRLIKRTWTCDNIQSMFTKCTETFFDTRYGITFSFNYRCERDEDNYQELTCEVM